MRDQLVDLIIENAAVYDGEQMTAQRVSVAIKGDKIAHVGECRNYEAKDYIDAKGLVLAPGFIDVHTHDDLEVLRNPHMRCKVSQGVTTVITGNCGISMVPTPINAQPVDPINLLGSKTDFIYSELNDYIAAFQAASPSVNLATLIGHTSLRSAVMRDLSKAATTDEIVVMQGLLNKAMQQGALGLSSGLAYFNAKAASRDEVTALAKVVTPYEGVYTTHLRTEFDEILSAIDEAFDTAKSAQVPLIISHLKCAGKANWGRAGEVIQHIEKQRAAQDVGCDCYPYAASSSTLDLNQVTPDTDIFITWSKSHPEMAARSLAEISDVWQLSLLDAAKKLQPAGAVYHCMSEQDVSAFLSYEQSMVGSDGLPCDPHPHPRLWGAFPRVLGHYSRDENVLSLGLAIYKMTALPSGRFNLFKRGKIAKGYFADLVLFDPQKIIDTASFNNPKSQALGIEKVWVNGVLSFVAQANEETIIKYGRAGRFLAREAKQ